MNVKKQLEYFGSLSYNEKKTKVLAMLNELKDTNSIFLNLYKTLNIIEKPNEFVINHIYEAIFGISNDIENFWKQEIYDKLNSAYKEIKLIHQKEIEDRANEWDPDNMIKNL